MTIVPDPLKACAQ